MEFTVVSACPHCGYPIYGYDKTSPRTNEEGDLNDVIYNIRAQREAMANAVVSTCDCIVRIGMTGPIPMEDV